MSASFVEIIISILLVLLPWAFGGVLPWSRFAIEAVAGLLTLTWVISLLCKERLTFVATAILQITVFAFGYFTFTLIRLPGFLIRLISPQSAGATAGLQTLGVTAHPSYRLTMDPFRTLNELLFYGACFIIFFAIVNTYQSKVRIRRFFYLVGGNGVLLSAFALVQRSFWNGKIFWIFPTESGMSFGTYFNHNHFAGYAEMAVAAVFALTLSHLAAPLNSKAKGWRRKFAWVTNRELPNIFLGLFLLLVLVIAIVYSLSRGALLSLGIALVLTKFLLCSRRQTSFHVPIIPFVVVLVMVAALSLVGASTLVHRFSNLASYTNRYRSDMWQDAARMAKDFPLFGVGLGAFNEIFPAYKRSHFEIETVYLESDWLQAVAELGLAGMVFVALILWVFFKNVIKQYTQRRDREIRSYLFGGTIGVVALLCHSLLDFNLHIPANALTFFALAAVVLITATTRDEGKRTLTPTVGEALTTRSRGFLLLAIGLLSLLYVMLSYFDFKTQAALYRWRSVLARAGATEMDPSYFKKPRSFIPLASEWHYEHARALEARAARPEENLIEAGDLRRMGMEAIREALTVAPGCGKYWATQGSLLSGLNELSAGEQNFDRALSLNRSSYQLFYSCGLNRLQRGKIEEGISKIAHARAMANVIPLEKVFSYVLYYTRDPQLLSRLVLDTPDDRALFKVLLQRHQLLPSAP